jgi:transcriptional regulator with XRE-family HTH domain
MIMNKKVGASSRNRNITMEQHIGKRLVLVRTANELSREALADALGITHQQIGKYERGENRISASTLYQMIKYFKVEPDFFYQGYSEEEVAATITTIGHITHSGVRVMNEIGKGKDAQIRQKIAKTVMPIIKALNYYYDEKAI